jgi:hypothetical protein
VIRLVKVYLREFVDSMRATWSELRAERNWLGLGVLVVLMPLIFVSAIFAALADIGPE